MQAQTDKQPQATAQPGLYSGALILCLIGAFAFELRLEGIFACPADAYRDDNYLAYCNSPVYGDYDHGALWFDLEPLTRQAASNADILFLGSSGMQFAFSTPATVDWFDTVGRRFYLLGFSHTENTAFAEPLLREIRPHAQAYVINIDRFFDDQRTEPVQQIFAGGDVRDRYVRKRRWQRIHRWLCGPVPAACGANLAFFRTIDNGYWYLSGTADLAAAPTADGPPTDRDRWPHFAALGKDFVASLPVERDCVLLTLAPSSRSKTAEAQAIAASLDLDLIVPRLAGLTTFDGVHLDRTSAQRWSQAFFTTAGPRLRRCLAG